MADKVDRVALWGLHMGFTQGYARPSLPMQRLPSCAEPPSAFSISSRALRCSWLASSQEHCGTFQGPQETFIAGVIFALLTLIGLLPLRGRLDGRKLSSSQG